MKSRCRRDCSPSGSFRGELVLCLFQILVAASPCSVFTWPLFLIKTLVMGFRVHPGDPGWCPHLEILNHICKDPFFPNKLELSNTAVLHQMRRDQVTDTCRANSAVSRKRRVLTPNDLKHLVVDEDHELIYCYVPKVACTNWKRLMMVLSGRGKYSDPMEIPANEAHVAANLKTLNQYSIPEINHRLKSYMKFLFVREPFERLVSAYRNKFTQKYNTSFHKRYGTKIIRRQRKNATQEALRRGDDVRFEEFVAYLIDPHTQREEPFNEHWQTVHSLCHPCHIRYDLVGKYETLEEDSNYVLRLAGVGSYLKFPTYAKSTRTTDEMTTEFFQNISSEHQTQLYEVYKLDFLMFNYSVPSYLKLE
uniref:Carbohydrate sulfotransferase n=1 Tax=Felis catus TaxID=9685 RepID=A0ABI7Y814_FELCA